MKLAVFTRRSVVVAMAFIGGALHQIEDDDEGADREALSLRR